MINEHFKVSSSQDERFTRNYKEIECSPVAGRWEPGNRSREGLRFLTFRLANGNQNSSELQLSQESQI